VGRTGSDRRAPKIIADRTVRIDAAINAQLSAAFPGDAKPQVLHHDGWSARKTILSMTLKGFSSLQPYS